MATASRPLLSSASARRPVPRRGNPLVSLAAAVLAGLAILAFFGHAFLNYDTFYALVWGRDIAHGLTPQYAVSVAPTPHPLATLVGVVLSVFGDPAEQVALGIVLLSLGLICVALYRLGAELYAWPVGVAAAVIAATRVPLLNFGIRGYVDFPMIALILWAAVLESRRPRRGAAVLSLLALAGLLRPEAWLYAGVYWLWLLPALRPRERVKLAVLAAAAPVLWLISDLAVTGDALWSLHGTHDTAATLHRQTGPGALPSTLPRHLGEIMRLPELVASVAGFAAGLVWFRERTLLPAAIAVLNGLAFVLFAFAGLSLITRYLFLAGTVLSLFVGLATFGWAALAHTDSLRSRWRAGAAVLIVAILAFVPSQVGRLDSLRTDIGNRARVQADLHALVHEPRVQSLLRRCGRVFVPNHGQVPLLALWADRRPAQIASAELDRPSATGLYFGPATAQAAKLSILDPRDPRRYPPLAPGQGPPRYRAVARNGSWVLFASCGPEKS